MVLADGAEPQKPERSSERYYLIMLKYYYPLASIGGQADGTSHTQATGAYQASPYSRETGCPPQVKKMTEKMYRCLCLEERLHAMGFTGPATTNLKCMICDGPEVIE